jgi:hypothetical protein
MMVACLAVMGVFGGAGLNKASAGTGSAGACGVSVWVDAYTYTTSATTVDFKATKGSSCGTVYYKAVVYQVGDGEASTGLTQTGYFSYATPVKAFYTSNIKFYTPYPGSTNTYRIKFLLYSDSGYKNYLGQANSHNITIY